METGLVLAMLSAASFAANAVSLRRALSKDIRLTTAVMLTVFMGTLLFLPILLFTGEGEKLWSLSWKVFALLGVAGIIHFVVGRFLNYNSIRLIGANKTSIITKTSILVAVILGIVILNESLTIPLFLGVSCIVVGATLVSIERREISVKQQGQASKTSVKGILSGLGAGLCWGVTGVLIKLALAENASPIVGIFIFYCSAALVMAGFLLREEQRKQLVHLDRSSVVPLAIASVFVSAAMLFRYVALSYSPVSLVEPLIGFNTFFVVLFSFFLNRHLEVFSWQVITGMVIATVGVFLLSY